MKYILADFHDAFMESSRREVAMLVFAFVHGPARICVRACVGWCLRVCLFVHVRAPGYSCSGIVNGCMYGRRFGRTEVVVFDECVYVCVFVCIYKEDDVSMAVRK